MKIIDFLDETSTKYEVSEHRPSFTAQQMASVEHVPGMMVAKPVVISADEEHYMCVLPACCKIDLDTLRSQLGSESLELADESEMARLFPDCALGAEPPFGGLYGMLTFMDSSLRGVEYIVFQGGTHDRSIKMEMSEYIRLANPRVLSFCYHVK